MKTKAKLTVYYDGLCKVCSKEITHYQKQTGSEQIEFIDICSSQFDAVAEGLNPVDIHNVMHVRRSDGSLAVRVDAFIEIWNALPKYKKLAKLVKFKPLRHGLDIGYNIFAKIRPSLPRKKPNMDCSASPYCEAKDA